MRTLTFLVLVVSLTVLANASHKHPKLVKHNRKRAGSYIVVFKDHIGIEEAINHMTFLEGERVQNRAYDDEPSRYYKPRFFDIAEADGTPMLGYFTNLNPKHAIDLSKHPDVLYIEEDAIVSIPKPVDDHGNEKVSRAQKGAPWGLARTSHREWDAQDEKLRSTYLYRKGDGKGVDVYVVDTGVYTQHPEFEGRASLGKSFVTSPNGEPSDATDENGHGTHVAGTIGSKTYGIAKKANIIAVRVLDANGMGSLSDVISGVGWVAKEHLKNTDRKAVINMSLGGGRSPTLDRAVNGAVASGVHVVVAAGNESADACGASPAAADEVTTVGATSVDDELAFFSNYGKCVDILAPGHQILSTWLDNGTKIISGTSMASPHVAGITASLLSRPDLSDHSPKDLLKYLTGISTRDKISKLPVNEDYKTPNCMAYNCPEGTCEEEQDEDDTLCKQNADGTSECAEHVKDSFDSNVYEQVFAADDYIEKVHAQQVLGVLQGVLGKIW